MEHWKKSSQPWEWKPSHCLNCWWIPGSPCSGEASHLLQTTPHKHCNAGKTFVFNVDMKLSFVERLFSVQRLSFFGVMDTFFGVSSIQEFVYGVQGSKLPSSLLPSHPPTILCNLLKLPTDSWLSPLWLSFNCAVLPWAPITHIANCYFSTSEAMFFVPPNRNWLEQFAESGGLEERYPSPNAKCGSLNKIIQYSSQPLNQLGPNCIYIM